MMDPKEWLNLRQLYRNRFMKHPMKPRKCPSLSRIKQGVGMCLGVVGGVVGVVGAGLLLLGLLQLAAGTYFMLALPIFQLGSNLWTGAWSSVCGVVVSVLAYQGKALKRGQIVLVATLSVLVANVANLVILQVGEQGVFLTEDNWRVIVGRNQEQQMRIALWLTTVASGVGISVSFLGAQYLFCAVVRGPKVKGRLPVTRSLSDEDLQLHQVVQMTKFPTPGRENEPVSDAPVGGSDGGCGDIGGGGGEGVAMHASSCNGGAGASGCNGNINGSKSGSGGAETSGCGGGKARNSNTAITAPGTPESEVPYFLRNHKSAWQFILPEVVAEETLPEICSRCSSLSRSAKSSFQPYRPTNMESYNPEGTTQPLEHAEVLRVPRSSSSRPTSRPSSRVSSSCSTSLYSVHESNRGESPVRRSPRVVRPIVPPPPPPSRPHQSDTLRSLSAGGWESCAVIEYPAQGGGGFVVDLD